jgi:ribose transport system substrate-binding protein
VAIATASTTATGKPSTATAAKAACGTVPAGPPNAPASLLKTLPPAVTASYAGLPYKIRASAYSHWKPKHGPPWTIGFVTTSTTNAYTAAQVKDTESWGRKLKQAGLVKNVIVLVNQGSSVPQQIQQMQSLIERKVDLIILLAASPTALLPSVQAAYKADIPVVVTSGVVDSPYVVNVDNSSYLFGGTPAAYMAAHELGGKGNVILMEGVPTLPNTIAQVAGAKAAFAACPGINVLATLEGDFETSKAQSAMLQYLTSHPTQQVDGVWVGGEVGGGLPAGGVRLV